MISASDGAGRSAAPAAPAGLLSHADVIWALVRRDALSRFSGNFLGFGWTYVVPLVWIGATYFAFYFFGRRVPVYTDTITFIISGIVPYMAFRYTVNSVAKTNAAMRRLVIFPTVAIEHGVIALALIEWVNAFVVFGFVAALNLVLFGNGELNDPLQFFWGVTLAAGLGASYGYVFVALTEISEGFRQLGVVILRPSFFISGVFFTANELPERVLPFFIWNPILHAVEIARDGMLFHYESRVASSAYPLLWILALTATGALIRLLKRN